MKKFLDHALMLFAVTALCVGFASCDSDDEEGDGATGSGVVVSIGDVKASFSHAYWLIDDANSSSKDNHWYEIQFYSFDYFSALKTQNYNAVPNTSHAMVISFEFSDKLDELPEGSWEVNDYEVSGALGISKQEDVLPKYYIEEGSGSGNLVITKANGKYTVAIKPLEIEYSSYDEDKGNESVVETEFTYTGTITRIPDEYLENFDN